MSCENILEVKHLCISASRGAKEKCLVGDINFSLGRGKVLGIVGESGSGKSITCYAVTGLLNPNLHISGGSIVFRGDGTDTELVGLCEKRYRKLRGSRITMVFQEPMSALNPVQRCGQQVEEVLKVHTSMSKKERKAEVLKLFEQVKLPDPQRIYSSYPHQLSGGQKQRVVIAMAVACKPDVIIADEPTTALDVTVQLQVLRLLKLKARASGTAVLFISHDMAVVSQLCDRLYVMYAGSVIESGPTQTVIQRPTHPYSIGLLKCAPEHGEPRALLPAIPGTVPNLTCLPTGCAFRERCFAAGPRCEETPALRSQGGGDQQSACWYPQLETTHV